MTGKQCVIAVIGMLLLFPAAQYFGKSLGEAQNSAGAPQANDKPDFSDTEVIVSRQPSEGITEADFDQVFLGNLESWTVKRTKANAKKYWDAENVPLEKRNIAGESTLVERYGHRFAVVRIRVEGNTPNATVVGVVGDEIVKIGCVNRSRADVTVTDGPCDAKIREVFAVSSGGDNG